MLSSIASSILDMTLKNNAENRQNHNEGKNNKFRSKKQVEYTWISNIVYKMKKKKIQRELL